MDAKNNLEMAAWKIFVPVFDVEPSNLWGRAWFRSGLGNNCCIDSPVSLQQTQNSYFSGRSPPPFTFSYSSKVTFISFYLTEQAITGEMRSNKTAQAYG